MAVAVTFSTQTELEQWWWFWLLFFYFLVPANLYLYGVNDLADTDTDARNEKKTDVERRVDTAAESAVLRRWVRRSGVLGVGLAAILGARSPSLVPSLGLMLFLLGATLYSAPPVRFKARPLLDAYSNGLYLFPFVAAFGLLAPGAPLPWLALIAGWCWTTAMHAFSAIPDIGPDSAAGIATTATLLGERGTLVFVGTHWLATATIAMLIGGWWGTPVLVYPILVGVMLWKDIAAERLYWYFPYITGVVGAVLWWSILYLRVYS